MKILFAATAWEDYVSWQSEDRKTLERINALIKEIARTPYKGTGKPEPLKHALAGYWSRRINSEHRLVYKIVDHTVWIVQVRYHY